MLGIEMYGFQALHQILTSSAEPFIPSCIKSKITLDETGKVPGHLQLQSFLIVSHPSVKFRADEIKILRSSSPFAFTDGFCILAAEPRLDSIGVFIFANV